MEFSPVLSRITVDLNSWLICTYIENNATVMYLINPFDVYVEYTRSKKFAIKVKFR